ncbi:MAG: glycosyltransferase family 4 protein [Chloroflexota bacterium]
MNIAIDALGISRPGGGRSATVNLLQALLVLDHENRYSVFLNRPEPWLSTFSNVRQVVLGELPAIATRVWAQALVPLYLRRWRADLVHHVKNLNVIESPCPSIVTVYDLTILRYPELYPPFDVWYWRHVEPRALRAASRVVAISRTTAEDLRRFYNLPADRVEVIYPSFAPGIATSRADPSEIRRRYGIEGQFVLHVGSISRKKNLLTLFRAFHRLRARGLDLKLVLVGRTYQKGHDQSLGEFLTASEFAPDVIFTGPVPDADLPGLYRAAAVVAFPSLHEGFGIVPVEAMAAGVPLVASTGGALAEVIGQGGWLIQDAGDDAELADAIGQILRDRDLRDGLIARGLSRAGLFAPGRAAAQTLDLYRRVARSSRDAVDA